MFGTSSADTRYEYEQIQETGRDPLIWWLGATAAVLVVALLVGVVYVLITGIASARAPRTAIEARLVILEEAVVDFPDSGKAWRDYIEVLAASGQFDKAERQLEIAREQTLGFETGPVAVGELALLWTQERYEETQTRAEELYDEQYELRVAWTDEMRSQNRNVFPTDNQPEVLVEILVYGARASGAVGDWQSAVDKLSEALEINPQAADLLALRGDAYAELGETESARADFEEALQYIPDYGPALAGLKALDE